MHDSSRTMTVPRALLVLGIFTAVGLGMVSLRAETAKASNRVQQLHQRRVALHHQHWGLEMELARLRAPEQIRRRAAELGLKLLPPGGPAGSARQGGETGAAR